MRFRIKPIEDSLKHAAGTPLARTLGAFQLTMLGVGSIIGTGIFVLTAEAAQKAGPAMLVSFVVAGLVCAVTALCYAEFAAMIPVSGSAYTYCYSSLGEVAAWMVGWALVLEYAVAASTVAVGWSNYIVGLLDSLWGIQIPAALAKGALASPEGMINGPSVLLCIAVTSLLVVGTKESARVNTVLVAVKLAALCIFCVIAIPLMDRRHFEPFLPLGIGGVSAAAASIFFGFVGFDAVSTAAEETRNPQRNIPIGIVASLIICTFFYLAVGAGSIGAIGAQPVFAADGRALRAGSAEFAIKCEGLPLREAKPLACSDEALADVLRQVGWRKVANLMGLAAFLALPSVVLMMMYGQTRIFFAMARDGLLPRTLANVHPRFRTPHLITIATGVLASAASAVLPVGDLADISNAGTLFAFMAVSLGLMITRRTQSNLLRPFRVQGIWVIAPAAIAGCGYLFLSLSGYSELVFACWTMIGLALYILFGRSNSELARKPISL